MSGEDWAKDFWLSRTAVEGPQAARFHSDHDALDLAAIAALADGAERILDLGAGTCVMANLIVDRLGVAVHAVDYVPEFLEQALDDPRLTTEVGDVRTYQGPPDTYDLVLLTGVITYLKADERRSLYERCLTTLVPGGALFIKAQFGVHETVEVDEYSEQMQRRYWATYPLLADEVAVLDEVFRTVTVTDPYPPALNRWENTHFHHVVARRAG